ncbi:hypothetical protein D3C87_926580 [compost metagenome]
MPGPACCHGRSSPVPGSRGALHAPGWRTGRRRRRAERPTSVPDAHRWPAVLPPCRAPRAATSPATAASSNGRCSAGAYRTSTRCWYCFRSRPRHCPSGSCSRPWWDRTGRARRWRCCRAGSSCRQTACPTARQCRRACRARRGSPRPCRAIAYPRPGTAPASRRPGLRCREHRVPSGCWTGAARCRRCRTSAALRAPRSGGRTAAHFPVPWRAGLPLVPGHRRRMKTRAPYAPQNAKQLHPSAPQKPEWLDTGTELLRAMSWAWACTPQAPWHWCCCMTPVFCGGAAR